MILEHLEKRAALKVVNKARRDFGLAPKKRLCVGIRTISSSCPLSESIKAQGGVANHISGYTGYDYLFNRRETVLTVSSPILRKRYKLPWLAQRFVKRFDNGTAHQELSV